MIQIQLKIVELVFLSWISWWTVAFRATIKKNCFKTVDLMRWSESGSEMESVNNYSSVQWYIHAVQSLRRGRWGKNPVHYCKTNTNIMRPWIKRKEKQIKYKKTNKILWSLYVSMWSTENEMFQLYLRSFTHREACQTLGFMYTQARH